MCIRDRKAYSPRDAIHYNYYTTTDGILEKENPEDREFVVPAKLKELILNKDFGLSLIHIYSQRYVVGLENLPLEQEHPHRRNVRSRSEPTHDQIP